MPTPRPSTPPQPAPPPDRDTLPHALTFFLDASDRSRVLRALRRRHADRATALLIALRLREQGPATGGDA